MKRVIAALIGLMMLVSCGSVSMAAAEGPIVSGQVAQQKLIEGNKRYVAASMAHPHQTDQRRTEVAKGQHPFAAILSCSDSRVPPEIIFDQGLGDLFVVRVAGNVLDDTALASLEYAVEHLGVRYIMVLGHARCGAVEATLKGGAAPGHIGSLLKAIQPAVDQARKQPGDPLDNAIKVNVARVVQQLKTSAPLLEDFVKEGGLTITGAYYDLDLGAVAILP